MHKSKVCAQYPFIFNTLDHKKRASHRPRIQGQSFPRLIPQPTPALLRRRVNVTETVPVKDYIVEIIGTLSVYDACWHNFNKSSFNYVRSNLDDNVQSVYKEGGNEQGYVIKE